MNAMTNAQLWHRRLGYLNKRSLEFVQRRDGNGVAFDGSIDHGDVCAVGKNHQLAHPKKAKRADITAPFQLVCGDLMGPFKPSAREGYEYVSKITDQFTKWTAVYLLCTKNQALTSLQLFVTSTAIPFGSRVVTWRADKGGEYTGEDFKACCHETSITQQVAATSTPQQIGVLERVGRTLCAMVRCKRVDSGYDHFVGGAHDGRVIHLESYPVLSTKHGDAVQEDLWDGRRPIPSQNHRRKGLRTRQTPNQARTHVVGRDGVRLQRDREQLLPHLEPQNASRGGEK